MKNFTLKGKFDLDGGWHNLKGFTIFQLGNIMIYLYADQNYTVERGKIQAKAGKL